MSVIRPQRDLFDGQPNPAGDLPDAGDIRRRLHAMLEMARAAESMPWSDREARVNAVLFPQMANWLPEAERETLCAAFHRELERLTGAV